MSETILVADPNIQFLDQTRVLLEQHGYNFLQAINGEEAKLKLEMDPVDLFLVNASMPVIDGASLCHYIKNELQRPIPVAMIVGHGQEMPSPEYLAEADSFLKRPMRQKDLFTCIQSLQTIRSLKLQVQELRNRLQDGGHHTPPPQAPPPAQVQAPTPAPVSKSVEEEEDTPLYPMKWFRKLAALEVKRAIRFHHPLSLLLLSYDLTEEFISGTPQPTMDQLSGALAMAVSQVIRAIDIPVQFSRDHILILLPNTGIEGAIAGATRIKDVLQRELEKILPYEMHPPPTVSVGATTSPTQGPFQFTHLLRDATRALREVRSQGGNGVFYC